jgi:DNA polymerase III alpha subunit
MRAILLSPSRHIAWFAGLWSSTRLHLELAFHGNAAEKLVNRGLIAIGQRMELPLVATNAVRFARPDDALAHKVLEAIGRGTTADGVLGHNGRGAYDLPTLTVEAVRAQAYLKTPKQMWRAFGQIPEALHATVEIADRCTFRLPLARRKLADQRTQPLGPGLLFGLEPAREIGEQQLADLVEKASRVPCGCSQPWTRCSWSSATLCACRLLGRRTTAGHSYVRAQHPIPLDSRNL